MLPAPNALNEYRLLGQSGLRVSPLCLGTMTFGTEWGNGADRDESRKMLDIYLEGGGNFIDTANFYTEGTSETYLGEFLEGRREEVVLGTKYVLTMRRGDPNASGMHRKNLRQSVEASLRRLRTDHIDLLWVHADDLVTPIEEVMRALDDLVRQGKVLHVGISDMVAWKIAQANTIADLRGWTPFTAIQIHWSMIQRTVERELVPMAHALGLAVTAWSPLESGHLTGKYLQPPNKDERRRIAADREIPKRFLTIARAVVEVAAEAGKSPAQVALNWLLRQPGCTAPILGARSADQLRDNLGSLGWDLDDAHVRSLTNISAIEMGFPHDFMANPVIWSNVTGDTKVEGM